MGIDSKERRWLPFDVLTRLTHRGTITLTYREIRAQRAVQILLLFYLAKLCYLIPIRAFSCISPRFGAALVLNEACMQSNGIKSC